MVESKLIPTNVFVETLGNNMSITLQYANLTGNVLSVFIADVIGSSNGVPYIEGEGVAIVQDITKTQLHVDALGNLILTDSDCDKYSLDESGNLIFTE